MAINPHQKEAESAITKSNISKTKQEFNWKNCWYPVTFIQDLPTDRPYSFSLYDEPFVLFRNQQGKLGCLTDLCPHRAAKLSDGQIIDGKIECLYHGWQFSTDGQCLHIPQLLKNAQIPRNACIKSFAVVERQGIVWIWAGEPVAADEQRIPTLPELDNPEFVTTDFMSDIPYNQNTLIENVIDPAHLPISHAGTLSNRHDALPLEMEVITHSVDGIFGRYRNQGIPNLPWNNISFVAPNLVVVYTTMNEERDWYRGVAAYSIPLGNNQCRLLFRSFQNFSRWQLKLIPRWLDHCYRQKILEQDMPQAAEQQKHIERLGKSPKEIYLPLNTSDLFPLEYRKWLDKYGAYLPFYQGYSTAKTQVVTEKGSLFSPLEQRLYFHTKICSSCNRAYQTTKLVKQILIGLAIALAALAILTSDSGISPVAVAGSLLAVVSAFLAQKLKTKFEYSHTRH
ncbi:MAG: aromatic ring-hydroxylating dioxygenase subunit alpha [Goleter apudmare HA4340-LM2]|jgi:phenylpropionate dioxygenase-like ring-hydroxylating dioxygenase large terminal subunit|nr:aromatic ring-hydroxylating dioxygenase subunit alpha [Goleter apudmare HA4340-LM2]